MHTYSNYYIKESIENKIWHCATVSEVVSRLEQLCYKITNLSRKQFMLEMISLGHGYDDPNGVYFTELMANKLEIGVITTDGRYKRCNIHEHARNAKYRNEMGD
jgi:hypothetical protein